MAAAYSWKDAADGNGGEVRITVPVLEETKAQDLDVKILKSSLYVGLKGQSAIIDGPLAQDIDPEESDWQLEKVSGKRCLVISLAKIPRNSALKNRKWDVWEQLLKEEIPAPDCTITHRCFLDISVDGVIVGKVILGLYGQQVPLTVENFMALCTGEKGDGIHSKPLCFKGCRFHRIVPGLVAESGDIVNGDGTSGESIYGAQFADESFAIPHSKAGLLSMANFGSGTNSSRFFITLKPYVQCNGRNVVFGEVLDGFDEVIRKYVEPAGHSSGEPNIEVQIADCGLLPAEPSEAAG